MVAEQCVGGRGVTRSGALGAAIYMRHTVHTYYVERREIQQVPCCHFFYLFNTLIRRIYAPHEGIFQEGIFILDDNENGPQLQKGCNLYQ